MSSSQIFNRRLVGASGFEPLTTRTPSVCATRLRYAPTAVFRLAECNIAAGVNQFNVSLGSDSNSAKMSDFDWSVISSAAREIFLRFERLEPLTVRPDNQAVG